MNKYLLRVSKCKTTNLVLKIKDLIESHREKLLQTALVNLGQKLLIDGIFGNQTARAICKISTNKLLNELNKLETTGNNFKHTNDKEFILAYLAREEGDYYHWNKNEVTYTAPYGVYKHANYNEEIIKYSDKLIKKYNIKETRKGIKELNKKLTSEERAKIRGLVYELYMRKYFDKRLDKILRDNKYKHLKLSIFSFSINTGFKRAIFKLQQTIGCYPDGLLGPKTLDKLNDINLSDNEINIRYLVNLKKYYDILIRENYNKYHIYKNGWYNRLRRLGLKI